MKQSDFDNHMKQLFEIKDKNMDIEKIETLIELDSLNRLKLLTFLSEIEKHYQRKLKILKIYRYIQIYYKKKLI